eukprot:TRINITY_DN8522_c0_g1_i1.p1 TRINITY_DN8522_c0_g1~~TRINITY_DN8522_c0_g1_i1.p1  ORF type:complete len:734 (-),score=91.37 TRINITY_DN8522_c0_g1_i1:433-2613(-)
MKYLYLVKLHLWPRFQSVVSTSLERHQPEVIELDQPLTPSMQAIQDAVVEVMQACLDELKETNLIDVSELTVENGLFKSFDTIIKRQLESVWHKTGPKTKHLVADLKTLRSLIAYLVAYDAVTYNRYLETLASHVFSTYSAWLFMPAAKRMFKLAKSRVYNTRTVQPPKKGRASKDQPVESPLPSGGQVQYELVLEENPKWSLVKQVLEEIEAEQKKHGGVVLIAVADDRTCTQLSDYLRLGGRQMMLSLFAQDFLRKTFYQPTVDTAPPLPLPKESKGRGRGRRSSWGATGRYPVPNRGTKRRTSDNTAPYPTPGLPSASASGDSASLDAFLEKTVNPPPEMPPARRPAASEDYQWCDFDVQLLEKPHVVIHPLTGDTYRLLRDLRPTFVIVYDPDPAFIRQLEVFKAEHPGVPLRVYFMMYDNSVEKQRYISALRKEKEAFEKLIREKDNMPIMIGQDGKGENLVADPTIHIDAGGSFSSRRGGAGRKAIQKGVASGKILVDHREFRSQLPCTLYMRGFEVVPCHLEVGDYIITSDLCVERKSIPDLVGSLKSGRLYSQVEAMSRRFAHYCLLIEFSEDQPFQLAASSSTDFKDEVEPTSVPSKLVLLTMHFPQLRILWSRSPHNTAELFEQMRKHSSAPPPNEQTINQSSSVADDGTMLDPAALAPRDLLLRLPGITEKNVRKVTSKVENMQELCRMSEPEIAELIGAESAALLFRFLHQESA